VPDCDDSANREEITEAREVSGWHVEQSLGRRFGCLGHSKAGRFSCSGTT
jgi:hypothetical protein